MKKLLFLLFMLSVNFPSNLLLAQVPESLNYQALARNAAGNALVNSSVAVRFTIYDGSPNGTSVYSERDTATTNQFGLFTTSIGTGNVINGTFAAINWGSGNKFLQVDLDPTGGRNYTGMGTTQILSAPYALYSKHSAVADTVLHLPVSTANDFSMLCIYDEYVSSNITTAPGFIMNWLTGLTEPLAVVDSDYSLNYDTIVVNVAGKYRISYEVSLSNAVGGSTGNSASISLWQMPGFKMNGTTSGIYLGTTPNAMGTASRSGIYNLTAGSQFWLNVTQITGNGTMATVPHGSLLRVERLGN